MLLVNHICRIVITFQAIYVDQVQNAILTQLQGWIMHLKQIFVIHKKTPLEQLVDFKLELQNVLKKHVVKF